jgi:hypothetical protein
MYKREYAVVVRLRYTEHDPDVADLVYRYVHDSPYGPSTEYWHFIATMDRDTAIELADNLNFVENESWKEETTSTSSGVAEIGPSTF